MKNNRINAHNFSVSITDEQKKFMQNIRNGIDKSLSENKVTVADALQKVLVHLPTDPVLALCEAYNINMPKKWIDAMRGVFKIGNVQ